MRSKEYYVDVVKRFIGEYFPNSSGVMLTGSFVSDYFNEYSDLDVIVLSRWHRKMFVESYEFEGQKIQIIALPLSDAHAVLAKDVMSRNGAIVSMLSKGLVLHDGKGILKKLKSYAKAQKDKKFVVPRESLDRERSRLTTVYEDVCGLADREELTFSIADGMQRALNLYLLANGSWQFRGKTAARELRAANDIFLKRYVRAFEAFFKDNDKSLAVDVLRDVLDSLGGELHYHTTKSYKDVVDADDMVVFVAASANDPYCATLRSLEMAFHGFVDRMCKTLDFVSYVNAEDGVLNRGLYVVIKSSRQRLNEEVVPLIQQFQFADPVSMNSGLSEQWSYPHMVNPLLVRAVCSQSLFDFLCSVSRGKFKCEDRLRYASEVLACLSESLRMRGMTNVRCLWASVFEMFLASHLDKMMPSECIEMVNDLKMKKIQSRFDALRATIAQQPCPALMRKFNFDSILVAMRESLREIGSELFEDDSDIIARDIYRLTDVVMDVVGCGSPDDKMLVAYAFSQQI